ncbi:hypothetical protein PENTCL1PPCAC_4689, partial [Pristionchus entomophagus]
KEQLLDRFTRLFSQCSRIKKLEIDMGNTHWNGMERNFLKKTLGDVKVEELVFTNIKSFDRNSTSAILDLLRSCKFGRLILISNRSAYTANLIICLPFSEAFYSEAVELVSAIEIRYNHFAGFSRNDIARLATRSQC